MPVLVIGADHPVGLEIVRQLAAPDREVRAFITSPDIGPDLRRLGVKVAVGDLSDESHITAAASRCFSLIMIEAALTDGRELAFADSEKTKLAWSRAAAQAGVTRAIWVGDRPPTIATTESVVVGVGGKAAQEVAAEAVRLDEVAELPVRPQP
jgi:nucleoside-diphosphate-sugar epimerase